MALAERRRPNVVIMDVRLPDGSGIEADFIADLCAGIFAIASWAGSFRLLVAIVLVAGLAAVDGVERHPHQQPQRHQQEHRPLLDRCSRLR